MVKSKVSSQENALVPFLEKPANKRVVERRCEVCDRGHMCFATAADLEPVVMESRPEISIGSVHRLQQDVVGSWRGQKTRIPDGTKLIVKNLHVEEKTGGLRVMVELPDGDTQWISANLLGNTVLS